MTTTLEQQKAALNAAVIIMATGASDVTIEQWNAVLLLHDGRPPVTSVPDHPLVVVAPVAAAVALKILNALMDRAAPAGLDIEV